MLTLSFMGMLHKSLDADGSALISSKLRLTTRLLSSAIFATLPLAHSIDALEFLGICAATLLGIVIAETVGKIGTTGSLEKISLALSTHAEDRNVQNRRSSYPDAPSSDEYEVSAAE